MNVGGKVNMNCDGVTGPPLRGTPTPPLICCLLFFGISPTSMLISFQWHLHGIVFATCRGALKKGNAWKQFRCGKECYHYTESMLLSPTKEWWDGGMGGLSCILVILHTHPTYSERYPAYAKVM